MEQHILDAKMYQYGVTKDVRDLPETQSIQKQITYGDHVFNTLDKSDNPKVRNAFILPYNKKLENFANDLNTLKYNDGNLAYSVRRILIGEIQKILKIMKKYMHLV